MLRATITVSSALVISTLVAACGGDSGTAGSADATVATDAAADTAGADTSQTDATADDASATEPADASDATQAGDVPSPNDTSSPTDADDAGDADPDSGDTSSCMYFEEPRLLMCEGELTQALFWQDFGDAGCASYYSLGEAEYPTLEALVAAQGCDGSCEYIATISVDVLGCVNGRRTGFDVYHASGEGCLEAVYNTPDGPLADICDWPERACYCDDTDGDKIVDGDDNCPNDANATQDDGDGDGVGDACDPCGADPDNDVDQDGVCGDVDNCPSVSNPPSDCDSDPTTPMTQCDADGDHVGDVCEP